MRTHHLPGTHDATGAESLLDFLGVEGFPHCSAT